ATNFAGTTRREQHFNGPAVLPTKIVKVGDIIIGLIAEARKVIFHAQVTGLAVTVKRPREIVQADETHGHVVERNSYVLPILMRGERLIGALVILQRFVEALQRSEE